MTHTENNILTHLDLFSGIGGFAYAADQVWDDVEQHLGRKLLPTEDVHHLNHNPLDNRIENLVVMPKKEHSRLHAIEKQQYPGLKRCVNCGTEFKVNPRKRSRNKCCSADCAMAMRIAGRKRQAGVPQVAIQIMKGMV